MGSGTLKRLTSKTNEKGSLVVEAAIVFPIVILAVFLVMYICYALYLQTHLQSIANETAEMGSSSWGSTLEFRESFKGDVSVDNIKNQGLYWRISDANEDIKCDIMEAYIYKKLVKSKKIIKDKNKPMEATKTNKDIHIEVDLKNYIIYKKVIVNVEKTITTPFDQVKNLFGLKKGLTLNVQAESVIDDPTELIRNTDFATDMFEEVGGSEKSNDIKNMMGKIKKFITDFL